MTALGIFLLLFLAGKLPDRLFMHCSEHRWEGGRGESVTFSRHLVSHYLLHLRPYVGSLMFIVSLIVFFFNMLVETYSLGVMVGQCPYNDVGGVAYLPSVKQQETKAE